ncbi:hypothetical protein C5167_010068 [Papaver somniferum]|uniref:Uncharacterized protein n=1 Tax=Papaver somniferum TaxID=3469 RepID=A0A4Y7JZ64_PAPSO|nr:uncharacterized protein LOC113285969 [Papaver somniferum]RZC66373.1 hypothetical protein C5167_010068 [Papaver somniferum]
MMMMMKRVSWLRWILFMFIAITNITSGHCLSLPGIVLLGHKGSSIAMMTHNRKVMEEIYSPSNAKSNSAASGNVNLEDYSPIDPVPTSKAAIKSAPIQHGTPLMPYIPKPPASPIPPKKGASPAPA